VGNGGNYIVRNSLIFIVLLFFIRVLQWTGCAAWIDKAKKYRMFVETSGKQLK